MAASILSSYSASNQTISCSVASLANNSQRESDNVDNTSNLYLDTLVMVKVKTGGPGATSVVSTGVVNVYAYGTSDGGTTYSDTATGVNAAITLTNPPNVPLIGVINTVASVVTYKGGPFSVAQAFGGVLPAKWGIVVENKSGAALDATESNHAKFFQGGSGVSI